MLEIDHRGSLYNSLALGSKTPSQKLKKIKLPLLGQMHPYSPGAGLHTLAGKSPGSKYVSPHCRLGQLPLCSAYHA